MVKIFEFNMMSLDGFFARSNGDLDWHNVDNEFGDFAVRQLHETSRIIFGRVTYEMMACFWPFSSAKKADPVVAALMNKLPKTVVSKTLKTVLWNNSSLVQNNIKQEILKLKESSAKDIAVFGSSKLSVSMIRMGLIDELRIMVNPVVLGSGIPLFGGIEHQLDMKLVSTKPFKSGNVLLTYQLG